jgi:hypothetical protein
MRVSNPMAFFLIFVMLVALPGCNGNEGQNLPVNTIAVSQHCIECHVNNGMSISPVTGGAITAEWLNSPHNTSNPANKSGSGSGCPNCHNPSHNHPEDCGQCHGGSPAIAASFINPDATLQCNVCHAPASGIKPLGAPHFNNFTGATHQAQYVDLQNQGKCRNCHNPHYNTVLRENRDWAVSGHGDVNGVAWTTEDFKNNAGCIRCHTATGYINYVTSTPAFTLPAAPLPASNTYGVLGCNACHASYAFKNSVRNVAQYTAPYNGGLSPQSFPDVGYTNICIPCHAGRENGDTIKGITDFTDADFKSSHSMASAGLMYMKVAFTSFTSAGAVIGTSTYGKSFSPDTSVPGGVTGGVSSTHRKLGTAAINYDNHNMTFFVPGVLDANGPCNTCHLNANGQPYRTSSHSLQIDANAFNQVCIYCHTSEVGVPLSGANFQTVFLEPQSAVFKNALALAASLLQSKYNIKYDPASYPFFFELPSGQAVKDWTRGTADQKLGLKLMGACFNINLLHGDPAAYAHARTYTRRLIYDTIDFLDDGKINLSVGATALASLPAIYGKNTTNAYTDSTLTALAPGTTESMVFLIGWSRTTGKWVTPERP